VNNSVNNVTRNEWANDEWPNDAPIDGARMHRFDPATESVAQAIVQYALERVRLDPAPIDKPKSPEELNKLGDTITEEGIGGMTALRLFCEELAPATISQDHPNNFAFVPGAPTEAAVLFDLVVGASSIFGGSWMEGSGAVWAENQALRWLADLAGFPEEAGGVFVSGGSSGNLSALVAARFDAKRRWGRRPKRWFAACSDGAHSSIDAAARVMDIELLRVHTDATGRMTADGLAKAFAEARARGIAVGTSDMTTGFAADEPEMPEGIVFALIATGGTTNAGIIDSLSDAADAAQTNGLWLHVDAAYGGAALCAPSVRERFNGIERADSFVVDPHKWLFAPYDCAALIYRNPVIAGEAHTQHAGYLDVLHDTGEWNPSDYAFHLTRRARGLPFWYSLATHGTAAYRDAVETSLTLTREVAVEITTRPELELIGDQPLSVVLFRRYGWTPDDYNNWSDRMLEEQLTFCVPTTIPSPGGGPRETVLRFCFTHPRTTLRDVQAILDTLR
jgi:L-2,4-diaminobutyrate decarboxylase